MDQLIGLGSQEKLDRAWGALLQLQKAKGFPVEFWKAVSKIRRNQFIDLRDYQSLIELINLYDSRLAQKRSSLKLNAMH